MLDAMSDHQIQLFVCSKRGRVLTSFVGSLVQGIKVVNFISTLKAGSTKPADEMWQRGVCLHVAGYD